MEFHDKIKLIKHNPALGVTIDYPRRATKGSVGYDIHACIDAPVVVPRRELWCRQDEDFKAGYSVYGPIVEERQEHVVTIPCGFSFDYRDSGTFPLIAPRSGRGCKEGLVLANSVGIGDPDYKGEYKLCVMNRGHEDITINPNDRIMQIVFLPAIFVEFVDDKFEPLAPVAQVPERTGGFGHTGS